MNKKFYNFLGLANKAGKLMVGYNKSEESVLRGAASLVIVSDELSDNSKKKFKNYCEKHKVPLIEDASTEELNKVLVGKQPKILSVVNKGMSRKLLELWQTENKI